MHDRGMYLKVLYFGSKKREWVWTTDNRQTKLDPSRIFSRTTAFTGSRWSPIFCDLLFSMTWRSRKNMDFERNRKWKFPRSWEKALISEPIWCWFEKIMGLLLTPRKFRFLYLSQSIFCVISKSWKSNVISKSWKTIICKIRVTVGFPWKPWSC